MGVGRSAAVKDVLQMDLYRDANDGAIASYPRRRLPAFVDIQQRCVCGFPACVTVQCVWSSAVQGTKLHGSGCGLEQSFDYAFYFIFIYEPSLARGLKSTWACSRASHCWSASAGMPQLSLCLCLCLSLALGSTSRQPRAPTRDPGCPPHHRGTPAIHANLNPLAQPQSARTD